MSLEEALALKRDAGKILDSYQPEQVERYWYEYWEKKKLFHADSQRAIETKKTYVMLLPPPK